MPLDPEPLDSYVYRMEDELNRLAGTLIGGMPTVGKATAALWWLGHRELAWASHNLLTPNQATGGEALSSPEGFIPLDGQLIEVIEAPGLIGSHVVQVTVNFAEGQGVSERQKTVASAIAFEDAYEVEPWRYYTASLYTKMAGNPKTPSRPNWMHLIWLDANDQEISTTDSDHHVSKQEWNLTWVTGAAPENAARVRVTLDWQSGIGEVFWVDKAIFYNGTDPQAWAFPEAGGFDLEAGLRAHLNMKAGIFNPDDFLTVDEAVFRIGRRRSAEPAEVLARIATPDRDMVQR